MAVSGKSRTFASSKHRKFQKLKDNKPSRRAARQHTWRAFFILGGSGIIVHYRLFLFARHGHNLMGESPERAPIAGSA